MPTSYSIGDVVFKSLCNNNNNHKSSNQVVRLIERNPSPISESTDNENRTSG